MEKTNQQGHSNRGEYSFEKQLKEEKKRCNMKQEQRPYRLDASKKISSTFDSYERDNDNDKNHNHNQNLLKSKRRTDKRNLDSNPRLRIEHVKTEPRKDNSKTIDSVKKENFKITSGNKTASVRKRVDTKPRFIRTETGFKSNLISNNEFDSSTINEFNSSKELELKVEGIPWWDDKAWESYEPDNSHFEKKSTREVANKEESESENEDLNEIQRFISLSVVNNRTKPRELKKISNSNTGNCRNNHNHDDNDDEESNCDYDYLDDKNSLFGNIAKDTSEETQIIKKTKNENNFSSFTNSRKWVRKSSVINSRITNQIMNIIALNDSMCNYEKENEKNDETEIDNADNADNDGNDNNDKNE